MSDTSERVGAVDGDALLKELTDAIKALEPLRGGNYASGKHDSLVDIKISLTHGRFALKPEASQETKWEKRWKLLEAWVGKCGTEEMAEKMAELEDAE